jgi:cobalamin biosynthesis protein CobW
VLIGEDLEQAVLQRAFDAALGVVRSSAEASQA